MKKIIAILFSVTLLGACDYDLTEELFSEIDASKYELSAKDIDAAIAPAYAVFGAMIGRWHNVMFDEGTDYMTVASNGSGWYDGGVYNRMHLHTWPDNQSHVWGRWNTYYEGINKANMALEQFASGSIPLDEERKPEVYAQLKSIRAYFYWLLMDEFGRVPLVLDFEGELTGQSERTDIYDFLVNELESIIPDLNTEKSMETYGKFNQWAARALLANIYLNAEVYTGSPQWDKVIQQCDAIINSGLYSLAPTYKENFIPNNENSPEIIYAVPCDYVYGVGINFHRACMHAASRDKYDAVVGGWGTGSVKGVPQFLDMYEEGDGRLEDSWDFGPQFSSSGEPLLGGYDITGKQLNFTRPVPTGLQSGESEGYRLMKYDPTGGNARLDNDIVLFRYAQVLMMKAEALLRTGDADGAAALVTQVRNRCFEDPAEAEISGAELSGPTTMRYGEYVEEYGLDYAQIIEAMQRDDDEYIAYKLNELTLSHGETIDDMPAAIAQIKDDLAGKTVSDYFIDDDVSVIQYGRMLDELGKEFVHELARRRNMIRFGAYTTMSWLTHVPNGEYRRVYPIPLNAMSTNSLLVQNEGYY